MPKVLISGTENQTNTITDIDQIALNLLHYYVSLVTCYCQFYCSVFEVSELGHTIITSYGKMHRTAEPLDFWTPKIGQSAITRRVKFTLYIIVVNAQPMNQI